MTCPHLGMRDDLDAFHSFASMGNRCFHCRRPATPLLEHQESYCLAGAQADCPAYLQDASKDFPAALRAEKARGLPRPAGLGLVIAIGLGLAVLGFEAWHYYPQIFGARLVVPVTGRPAFGTAIAATLTALPSASLSPASPSMSHTGPLTKLPSSGSVAPMATRTKTPTSTATRTPTSTATRTSTSTATKTPTKTPSATPSKTPTGTALPHRHSLEIPFDLNGHKLLLHWVGGGETFEMVEAKYGTTAEVIRSLNNCAKASLLANTVIVVVPGLRTADTTLPSFRVRQVGQPPVTIEELALQFNVDAALVKRYNGCTDACSLAAGDWVLIPVAQQ